MLIIFFKNAKKFEILSKSKSVPIFLSFSPSIDLTGQNYFFDIWLLRCNTGKKFPIGRNANYLTLGHSQVLANVA